MNRQPIGAALLATAVVLAVVGLLLWQRASQKQEADALTAQYARAILLDEGNPAAAASVDVEPDAERTPAISLLVVAGLAAIGGAVVLVRGDA